jgi:hypothetical protein
MNNKALRATALLLLLGPMIANADLISALENMVDNGTYTSDRSTGLDWLDLSETSNATYDSAESNNPGWRYASNLQVEDLFAMFFEPTFVDSGNGYQESTDAASLNEASLFLSLLGITVGSDPYFTALGYYMDEDSILRAMGAEMERDVITGIVGPEWFIQYGGSARVAYGTYMVRASSVPEPGSLALFGLGLAAMGLSRRKKKV